jgi:hypothetical protein
LIFRQAPVWSFADRVLDVMNVDVNVNVLGA